MIPVFFIVSILLVVWLQYQKNRSDRDAKKSSEAFWEKELRANTTRKKDISQLNYIIIPFERFPVKEVDNDEELSDALAQLQELSEAKIVNFTGITNTELKLTYGAPNITLLTEFDQNYAKLVRTLYKIGKLLYERKRSEDAIPYLRYGIEIHTDISANYTLLATIYKEKNEFLEIDSIISAAEQLNSMTKSALLENLMVIRNSSVSEE